MPPTGWPCDPGLIVLMMLLFSFLICKMEIERFITQALLREACG